MNDNLAERYYILFLPVRVYLITKEATMNITACTPYLLIRKEETACTPYLLLRKEETRVLNISY